MSKAPPPAGFSDGMKLRIQEELPIGVGVAGWLRDDAAGRQTHRCGVEVAVSMEHVMRLRRCALTLMLLTAGCGNGDVDISGDDASGDPANPTVGGEDEDDGGNNGDDGDDNGDSDVNRAPMIAMIPDQNAVVGSLLSFTVGASDPDGDGVTLSSDGTIGPGSDPYPAGAIFEPSSGRFSWTPAEGDEGDYSVRFTATDDGEPMEMASRTVSITVAAAGTNQPPVFSSVGDQTVGAGELLAFIVAAVDRDTDDTLTYSAMHSGVGDDPFTASPPATFNPLTREFVWTPDESVSGQFGVTFAVSDDGEPILSDMETITITVAAGVVTDSDNVVITEVSFSAANAGMVEITNRDASPVDISGWRLCGSMPGNEYSDNLFPTGTVLQPGDQRVVHWNQAGTDGMPEGHVYTGAIEGDDWGSIAIYVAEGSFNSAAPIRAFLQWREQGENEGRCNRAVEGDEWSACSAFVDLTTFVETASICLPPDADETVPTSFVQDTTGSFGTGDLCD
ncbi:MAG: putative Ig domain-containing protein [Myxococcota bacterium]